MSAPEEEKTPMTDKALRNTQGLFRAAAECNGFAHHARTLEKRLRLHSASRERMEKAVTAVIDKMELRARRWDTAGCEEKNATGDMALSCFAHAAGLRVMAEELRSALSAASQEGEKNP